MVLNRNREMKQYKDTKTQNYPAYNLKKTFFFYGAMTLEAFVGPSRNSMTYKNWRHCTAKEWYYKQIDAHACPWFFHCS